MSTSLTETVQTRPETGTSTTWRIDTARSQASFSVKNRFMMVMQVNVVGTFSKIAGTIKYDSANVQGSHAEVSIDAATLDTKMAKRDAHLKSADFFDIEKHPQIRFVSTSIEAVDPKNKDYRVNGTLTIRNISHPVSLDVKLNPPKNTDRAQRLVFTGTTTVDRRVFGMGWSKPPMSKPANEVELTISVEAVPAI